MRQVALIAFPDYPGSTASISRWVAVLVHGVSQKRIEEAVDGWSYLPLRKLAHHALPIDPQGVMIFGELVAAFDREFARHGPDIAAFRYGASGDAGLARMVGLFKRFFEAREKRGPGRPKKDRSTSPADALGGFVVDDRLRVRIREAARRYDLETEAKLLSYLEYPRSTASGNSADGERGLAWLFVKFLSHNSARLPDEQVLFLAWFVHSQFLVKARRDRELRAVDFEIEGGVAIHYLGQAMGLSDQAEALLEGSTRFPELAQDLFDCSSSHVQSKLLAVVDRDGRPRIDPNRIVADDLLNALSACNFKVRPPMTHEDDVVAALEFSFRRLTGSGEKWNVNPTFDNVRREWCFCQGLLLVQEVGIRFGLKLGNRWIKRMTGCSKRLENWMHSSSP